MHFVGLLYQMLLPDKVMKIRRLTVSIVTTLEMSFDAFLALKDKTIKTLERKSLCANA